ncbi:nucleoid-associated protein [Sphingobacterium corticibacterium]|uniref:nucleoid-associated protein n=1 Tax=Sphingobacterium corticibacterium TaxID=2484746 RepID=UPI0013EE6172|nr:nucleoid-associated protein [Sphingobacterium corticibacterium]
MELKKIGENLEIKNFVIHQLLKTAGFKEVKKKAADGLIAISEKEQVFMGNLDKSYHRKSSPIYGIFSGENPRFRDLLIGYKLEEYDFLEFSKNVLDYYGSVLSLTPTSTGGYMILCEYTNKTSKNDFLLVLMINNKEGYVVNEKNLTLENIKNLDLSKVDVACLINLTEWANIENEEETDRITYLSFVKGMKQVSHYFMTFIDCDNKNTNSESSQRLLTAMNAFFEKEKYSRKKKSQLKNDVFAYCEERMKNKKEILLSYISQLINKDDPESFQNFAIGEDYKVSSVIGGDKAKMKQLKYVSYEGENYKIEFEKGAMLLDKTVVYDKKSNDLIFKNIPMEFAEKIKAL